MFLFSVSITIAIITMIIIIVILIMVYYKTQTQALNPEFRCCHKQETWEVCPVLQDREKWLPSMSARRQSPNLKGAALRTDAMGRLEVLRASNHVTALTTFFRGAG